MKKIFHQLVANSYELGRQFYKDQQGVYMYLGGMLAIVILGLIALAVDGSGIYLDKARFIQAMDQGALSVATENNTKYRENMPNHADVARQVLGSEHKNKTDKEKFSVKQEMRNQELVQGLVRVYLRSYNKKAPNSSDLPIRIENPFDIKCKEEIFNVKVNDIEQVKKPIICKVSGEIKRKSWLPLENNISFGKEVDINSGVTYGVKDKGVPVPIDVMLVLDFSTSMYDGLNNKPVANVADQKISILKNVVGEISDMLLPATLNNSISPYNRIGFVTFASAAQQNKDKSKCVLPYYPNKSNPYVTIWLDEYWVEYNKKGERETYYNTILRNDKSKTKILDFYKPDIKSTYRCTEKSNTGRCLVKINVATATERALNLIKIDEDSIREFTPDFRKDHKYYYFDPDKTDTLKQISKFDGRNINYPLTFKDAPDSYEHEKLCGDLSSKEYTTQAWFDRNNREVRKVLNNVALRNGTNITSGFLVGANLIMNANSSPDVIPEKLGTNTQRVILVLSDGQDNFPAWDTAVNLLQSGMCTRTRERVNSLQSNDPALKSLPLKIGFVAFGAYEPDKKTGAAWKECVGEENFFMVKDRAGLLNSFKQIIGLQEEVGKISITPPTFK